MKPEINIPDRLASRSTGELKRGGFKSVWEGKRDAIGKREGPRGGF